MKKKIGVVSLGCPKNLVDTEVMLGMLKKGDYEITNDEKEAQVIIVNTCGFIDAAKQESINAILEMAELKKEKCEVLVVTGCLAERYRNSIFEEIPEVDAVVGTGSCSEIANVIQRAYSGEKPAAFDKLDNTLYLDNERVVTSTRGVAYLKIAEGCDNNCTYCVIPSLRGPYRSRSLESVVNEAKAIAKAGAREIILVAQDTTRYGIDLYGEKKLVPLIREISDIDEIEWIRILYSYPEDIDDALIHEIASNPKVCKYIDIPIQHASDSILKQMGRRGRNQGIREIIRKIRHHIPEVVIRTTFIVGFPGESQEDFEILRDFISEMKFDKMGAFIYSKEEGTPASRMKYQIPEEIKEERYNQLMGIQQKIAAEKNHERLNRSYKVLVEGVAEDGIFYKGRTYAEAPDIDGFVYFTSREPLEAGSFVKIKVLDQDSYDLIGDVIDEFESAQ